MQYRSNLIKIFFVALVVSPLLLLPSTAFAQNSIFGTGDLRDCLIGKPIGCSMAPNATNRCEVNPGSCSVQDILVFANNIIKYIIGISGAVALLMYIVGGVWMIFSTGNPGRISRGKDIIIGTSVSLIFILGGYLIVQFIVNNALNSEIRLNPEGPPPAEESGCCLIEMVKGDPKYVCFNNLTRSACEAKRSEIKGNQVFSLDPKVLCKPASDPASKCSQVDDK